MTAGQRREGTRRREKTRVKETKLNWNLDNGYDGKLLRSKEKALTAKKKKQRNKQQQKPSCSGSVAEGCTRLDKGREKI